MSTKPGEREFRLLLGLIVLSMVLGVIALVLGHRSLGFWLSNGGTLATLLGFGSWVLWKTRRR